MVPLPTNGSPWTLNTECLSGGLFSTKSVTNESSRHKECLNKKAPGNEYDTVDTKSVRSVG